MLNENDIVEILAGHLIRNGYEIIQLRKTNEKGPDIIVDHAKSKQRLFIEAKGETSSKEHTNGYGNPFKKTQIRSHVAKAILASMKILSSRPAGAKTKVGMAFPITDGHKMELETVKNVLKQLDIKIFWVSRNKVIEE